MNITPETLAVIVVIPLVAGIILAWVARGKISAGSDAGPKDQSLHTQLDAATAAAAEAQSEARDSGEARAAMQATVQHLEARITELARERDTAREDAAKADRDVADMRRQLEVGQAQIAQERQSLAEQAELVRQNRIELTQAFTAAAQKLFQEESNQFRMANAQEITKLLQPFREQIDQLQKGVVEASKERHSLQQNIERIALEAHSLTNALRGDPKAQGDWGEMVVETILQNSGLVKDVNYFIQYPAKNEQGGTVFLDVLLKLPEDRYMVVDSKTSITDYDRYMNAETDEERQGHLKALVTSLKSQINGLSGKSYDRLKDLTMLEAVLMWVPNEGALTTAIREDRTLVEYAHKRRVIPVTATTLFATVKVVERLWQYEKQNRSVQDIIERASKIYDKFVGFTEAMDGVGKSLEGAMNSFHIAKGRLLDGQGNVVRQLEQLHDLAGLPTKGRLKGEWSQRDGTPEPLVQPTPDRE